MLYRVGASLLAIQFIHVGASLLAIKAHRLQASSYIGGYRLQANSYIR